MEKLEVWSIETQFSPVNRHRAIGNKFPKKVTEIVMGTVRFSVTLGLFYEIDTAVGSILGILHKRVLTLYSGTRFFTNPC